MEKKIKKISNIGDSRNIPQSLPTKAIKTANLATLSDDEIIDLFTTSFEDRIAKYNNIESFDVAIQRKTGNSEVRLEVTISGTAGSPTVDQWKKETVENAATVTISRDDKGSALFTFLPKETVYLNSTEYIVTYVS